MAFNAKGFKTLTHIGTPDVNGAAGTNVCLHAYVTNDDTAAVITVGYFNSLAARLKKGDIIMMSLDNDGAPMLRNYLVTANDGTVVTIAAQNVA
ncbi:hypothetical protein LB566_23470 [Mesorhizobium sp. CA13]|uniref:hypothetical protein n=1 Tax=Mesorhizobium sp. CA13 TaxID=2876643 RepID=UPI001CC976D8|nr:hypothetical protein [Mesorhizobium sp. CA13]MBZ9856756.1 hypothetical protein [Mesorhizobium sp. CA13]